MEKSWNFQKPVWKNRGKKVLHCTHFVQNYHFVRVIVTVKNFIVLLCCYKREVWKLP